MENKMVKQFSLAKLALAFAVTLQFSGVFAAKPTVFMWGKKHSEKALWENKYNKDCKPNAYCTNDLIKYLAKEIKERKMQNTLNEYFTSSDRLSLARLTRSDIKKSFYHHQNKTKLIGHIDARLLYEDLPTDDLSKIKHLIEVIELDLKHSDSKETN